MYWEYYPLVNYNYIEKTTFWIGISTILLLEGISTILLRYTILFSDNSHIYLNYQRVSHEFSHDPIWHSPNRPDPAGSGLGSGTGTGTTGTGTTTTARPTTGARQQEG
jgi:hypothetical protein